MKTYLYAVLCALMSFAVLQFGFQEIRRQTSELASVKDPIRRWRDAVEPHPLLQGAIRLSQNPQWVNTFGDCLVSTTKGLVNGWMNYRKAAAEKVKLNAAKLNQALLLPPELAQHIIYLFQVEPILDDIENLQKSAVFAGLLREEAFRQALATPDFLRAFRSPSYFQQLLAQPKYEKLNLPVYRPAIDQILKFLGKEHNIEALSYLREADLSLLDPKEVAGARALIKHYRNWYHQFFKINSQEPINAFRILKLMTQQQPEYRKQPRYARFQLKMVDITYPANIPGAWAQLARDLTEEEVRRFLLETATGNSAIDDVQAPETDNVFDTAIEPDHMRNPQKANLQFTYTRSTPQGPKTVPVTPIQRAAIEHVARTLWGEVRGCTDQCQIEMAGRVIADRTAEIQRNLDHNELSEQMNQQTIAQIDEQMLAGKKFGQLVKLKLGSLSAYGRKDRPDEIPLAAQVTSKAFQFSVWNFKGMEQVRLSSFVPQLHPNIPNILISVARAPTAVEKEALVNVLCPQIEKNAAEIRAAGGKAVNYPQHQPIWEHILDVSSFLVMEPERFKDVFSWNPESINSILFYTHQGVVLRFANRSKATGLKLRSDLKKPIVVGKGEGTSCAITLWVAKPQSAL